MAQFCVVKPEALKRLGYVQQICRKETADLIAILPGSDLTSGRKVGVIKVPIFVVGLERRVGVNEYQAEHETDRQECVLRGDVWQALRRLYLIGHRRPSLIATVSCTLQYR